MRNFKKVKRVIIKIGSSSITDIKLGVKTDVLDNIMKMAYELSKNKISLTIVTSGAIAAGMHELGFEEKPKVLSLKQACASVGQAKLMEAYSNSAKKYGLICGQILVSHDDFGIRKRTNLLSNTLDSMINNGIIPIINENDTLAVEEIKVGDNDTLSSYVAPMISADLLILFSDIDGLYDKNPKVYDDAKLISVVEKIDKKIVSYAGGVTSSVGTGGMATKINAALISTSAGCNMLICNSNRIGDLLDIIKGEEIGTLFLSNKNAISSKEHWMIFTSNSYGDIIVDSGLEEALKVKKVSILSKGIKEIKGQFLDNKVINIKNEKGQIIAKGVTNYSSEDILKIIGHDSKDIDTILGKKNLKPEVIHANKMVVLRKDLYGRTIK